MSEQIFELHAKVEKLGDHANDLEIKLNEALKRLAMISVGNYFTNEVLETDSGLTRVQKCAAFGLAKIARMQERKP